MAALFQQRSSMVIRQRLKLFWQYALPQQALTQLMGWVANTQYRWIKNSFIAIFSRLYKINLSEAVQTNPFAYPSFHDFFIRRLKTQARPIDSADNSIVSPADGLIAQIGNIDTTHLIQAKGRTYTLEALLAGDSDLSQRFQSGIFSTIYLAPHNYHRVHMPVSGTLRKMIHVPGTLFSVSLLTAERVPDLFARNERVVCFFDTAHGPMAVILVGAMIVGSISTVWAGNITPPKRKTLYSVDYPPDTIRLKKGEELGHFSLGSTVIMLFAPGRAQWNSTLNSLAPLQVGQKIGELMP